MLCFIFVSVACLRIVSLLAIQTRRTVAPCHLR
jgi:hypothetical protein